MVDARIQYATQMLENVLSVLSGDIPVPTAGRTGKIGPAKDAKNFKGAAHHLSEAGGAFLDSLFEKGLTNRACAEMLGITDKPVKKRREKWLSAKKK